MKENVCENFLIAKMAEIDDEEIQASTENVESHLKTCENCRHEIEQMKLSHSLLNAQVRQQAAADLWPNIELHLQKRNESLRNLSSFVFVGLLLVSLKLLEMIPEQGFGLAFRLIPLGFVVAIFAILRENPFKINTRLTEEDCI